MPRDDGTVLEPVHRVNAWVLTELPSLNQDILARRRPPGDLGAELARSVLADLPRPESLTVRQAQQLVVLLGLAGASLGRHYQELNTDHRVTPERAFDPCPVGPEAIPFRAYFGRLAERTGTGHCHRDSYAALTRWNVPTTEVWWAGERVAVLAGVFRVNAHFAALPPEEGLRAEYFMDVFRQYAVHWAPGDIPPSGALDPEAIARDYLLGVRTPSYQAHVERILPALLGTERELLSRLAERPSLPHMALRSLGIDAAALAEMSPAELRATVGRRPVLAALYLLLIAHARMSGVHLKIAQKYLFAPQRRREIAGLGDPHVVSNRRGTTGMDERYLQALTRARHQHVLACLHALGGSELDALAGLDRVRAASADLGSLVRFTGSGTPGSCPVAWLGAPGGPLAARNAPAGVAAVSGGR